MLVVVKKPRTKNSELEIRGKVVPAWIIDSLKKKYNGNVTVTEDDEELINIHDTDWYKKMKSTDSPARSLRVYRQRDGLSQGELGKMLGMSSQNVYEMEKNKRGISKDTAKKLSLIFNAPVDRFI